MAFDSYILPSSRLPADAFRLLDVDNRTTLPYGVRVRALVSSADVLHS